MVSRENKLGVVGEGFPYTSMCHYLQEKVGLLNLRHQILSILVVFCPSKMLMMYHVDPMPFVFISPSHEVSLQLQTPIRFPLRLRTFQAHVH